MVDDWGIDNFMDAPSPCQLKHHREVPHTVTIYCSRPATFECCCGSLRRGCPSDVASILAPLRPPPSMQVCRVAYELMQTLHVDAADRFSSLDDIYYYGGQSAHEQTARFAHRPADGSEIALAPGDTVGIAGRWRYDWGGGVVWWGYGTWVLGGVVWGGSIGDALRLFERFLRRMLVFHGLNLFGWAGYCYPDTRYVVMIIVCIKTEQTEMGEQIRPFGRGALLNMHYYLCKPCNVKYTLSHLVLKETPSCNLLFIHVNLSI